MDQRYEAKDAMRDLRDTEAAHLFGPLDPLLLARGALGEAPPLLLSLPLLLLSPLLSAEARTLAGDAEFSSMDNAFFIPV